MNVRQITPNDRRQHFQKGDLSVRSDHGGHPRGSVADWRIASVTAVLPVPDTPDGLPADRLVGLEREWQDGRYLGLSEVEFPDDAGGGALRSFHSGVRERLGSIIATTVGDREQLAPDSSGRGGTSRLQHLLLDPEEPGTRFEVREQGGSGDAHVYLRAVEFLQYSEADADPRRCLIHRFLVLHVYVENCTDATLEAVSQGMRRPRGFVEVRRPEGMAPLRTQYPDSLGPLEHFGALAIERVDAGFRDGRLGIKLTKGGYLSPAHATVKGARSLAPPHRVVMALPMRDVVAPPSTLDHEEDSTWSPVEKWAWSLAVGADRFVEAYPAETRARAETALCGAYRSWTLWASEFGLAIVRHRAGTVNESGLRGETTFAQLAQTRYVDLTVLVMRAYEVLSAFAADLAAIDREVEESLHRQGTSPSSTDGADRDRERLRRQLQRLEAIQADFVLFRERLWFHSVPRHLVDTRIMLNLREKSGVDRLYAEFVDELALRREVYSTQYSAREIEASNRRELLAQEEQRQREEEREASRRSRDRAETERHETRAARDARSERLNQVLAVAAVVFAVPAIIESFGLWASPLAGLTVLVSMVVFGAIGIRIVSRWTGRDATKAPDPPDA